MYSTFAFMNRNAPYTITVYKQTNSSNYVIKNVSGEFCFSFVPSFDGISDEANKHTDKALIN